MVFDICFYRYGENHLSQCPELDYAKDIIIESLELTLPLHGKRQLSLIKRGDDNGIRMFIIYNYVFNDRSDTFGVCIAFYDKYPHDIDYMFRLCGLVIADVINEGKVLYFDSNGVILDDNNSLECHYSTLKKHKEKIKSLLQKQSFNVKPIPLNVFNIYIDQYAIFQLSDKSWSLEEALNYNNIVVVTEEIEDENINSMRSIIINSNATIAKLNQQIINLKTRLKGQEENEEKNKNKVESEAKVSGKASLFSYIIGFFVLFVLLNLVVPWFIPLFWPKIAVPLTALGVVSIFCAENAVSFRKTELLGWCGNLTIFLSTIIILVYSFGVFSTKETVTDNRMDSVVDAQVELYTTIRQEATPTHEVTNISIIPENFVFVPSGILKRFDHYDDNMNSVYKNWAIDSFYISKFEVIQKDYESLMGSNPSLYKDDSIPVHNLTNFDAVLYCNKKSEAEGFDGFYEIDSNNKVKVKENGNGYRLPTDNEWILAARNGSKKTTRYAAGDNLNDIAWYGGNSRNKPHRIGQKLPNGRGLFDMNGNVLELCLFNDGTVWGKGSSYQLYIAFDDEGGIGHGGTLSKKKEPTEDAGIRLVFVPK